jgi:LysR family transcriptional regulator, regulator for metE and metH
MDVDTRSLELLEAVAAHGTLTAASKELHVSQPALSQRLTGLESRLGLPLFERQGRRLVPTRAGTRMLHAASAVLAELRAAARDLDDLRTGRASAVRFSSECTTNYQWFAPVLHEFRDRCPGVAVRIESVPGGDQVGAVLADRLDVALVCKPDRRLEALEVRPIFEDELVAVVAGDHPWVGRAHVEAADFDGAELVLNDAYDPTRVPAVPPPIPAGSRPTRITTVPGGAELLVEMVASSRSVSVMPQWLVEPYLPARDIATVRITEAPQRRTWSLVTRRGDQPAPVGAFLELVAAHAA